jgi:hypothetical protein
LRDGNTTDYLVGVIFGDQVVLMDRRSNDWMMTVISFLHGLVFIEIPHLFFTFESYPSGLGNADVRTLYNLISEILIIIVDAEEAAGTMLRIRMGRCEHDSFLH